MAGIPSYKITGDDLPEMDSKTLRAIGPLLDALNLCLTTAINVLNTIVLPQAKSSTFTTDSTGAATITLTLTSKPQNLWLSAPPQATTVYSMTWIATSTTGVKVSFLGLTPQTKYNFTIMCQ